MLRRLITTFLLLLLSLAPACKSETATPANTLKIAVIPKATTGQFWQTVHAGANKAAKDLGVKILWVGTEKEDQRARQINILDSQVVNRVDGIVLAPLDADALVRPVRQAIQAKIPVVVMDSALMEEGQRLQQSFVATDNHAGGRLAGEAMAQLLSGSGKVVMLRHQEGSASTGKREAGFLKEIAKHPDIQVVSQEQYGGRDPQKAAENLLHRFTQNGSVEIDGIFCPNLTTTYGMLQALRRARLAGKIKLIGFDSDESLINGIQQGEIHGLVLQDPFNIGYLGVKTMVEHLQGKAVPPRVNTGLTLVTKQNLKDPQVQSILTPDLEKWL